jgi:hypothetical protein
MAGGRRRRQTLRAEPVEEVDVVSGVAAGGRRRKQTLHTGGVENEGVSFTAGVSFADERAEAPVQRRRSRKQTLAVTAETEGEAAGRLSGSGGDSGGAQDEAPARRRARKQTLAAAVDDGVQHGEAGTEGSGGPQPSRPDGEQLEPEPEPAEDGAGPQIHDLSEFGQKAAAQLRAAAEDAERATQARSDAFARWVAWLALVWLQRERERERERERDQTISAPADFYPLSPRAYALALYCVRAFRWLASIGLGKFKEVRTMHPLCTSICRKIALCTRLAAEFNTVFMMLGAAFRG